MQRGKPGVIKLIVRSFKELAQKDPLRLAGATAFFTTFALPAVLLIMLQLARIVLTRQESTDQLYHKVNKYIGPQMANHLINVLKAFEKIAENQVAIIAGFVFLLFVATTLF